MSGPIKMPEMTRAEWLKAIAAKSKQIESVVEEILTRHGVEVQSIAPRRKSVVIMSVKLAGKKTGQIDIQQKEIPDAAFEFSWEGLGPNLWILTSDDNSKGKSSILNVIKAAIKGKFPGDIKPDVWRWLSSIEVCFSLDGVAHRVSVEKPTGVDKANDGSGFAARLDRKSGMDWINLGARKNSEEFESMVSDFFMQELGFEKVQAYQKRTEGTKNHGWPAMGSALFLSGSSPALFGQEVIDGLPIRLLQLFIGLPWISTYTTANTCLKRVEAEGFKKKEASRSSREELSARIAILKLELDAILSRRHALPDREKALIRKREADRKLTVSLDTQSQIERGIVKLRSDLTTANDDYNENRNLLQQARDEATAGYVFRRLRPLSCPSCDAAVNNDITHNDAAHNCALCGKPPVAEIDETAERIELLKAAIAESRKIKTGLEKALESAQEKLTGVMAEIALVDDVRSASSAILAKDDTAAELERKLIGLEARIEELESRLPPESAPEKSIDRQVLKATCEITGDCFQQMQTDVLVYFSKRLQSIATAIGVENLQEVEVRPSKIAIRQGGAEMTFSDLNAGENLRFRTAAALAAVETAQWTGVGRHPGFIVLDSPASQEMAPPDFAAILANLKKILEQNPEMQVIVGALMRPEIADLSIAFIDVRFR